MLITWPQDAVMVVINPQLQNTQMAIVIWWTQKNVNVKTDHQVIFPLS